MINTYPNFSKLLIDHKDEVSTITSKFDPYSDFNFTSAFCWSTSSDTEIALLNGNLVLRLPDYITGKPVISVLGNQHIDKSLDMLLADHSTLHLVPEAVVSNIQQNDNFIVTEDQDNFDYIYSLNNVAYLPGGSMKKKRNKTQSVVKHFGDRLSTTRITSWDSALAAELDQIFLGWAQHAPHGVRDIKSEKQAFDRLLKHADKFELIVTLVNVDSKPVAFSISEVVDDTFAICHFEKALPVHEQIYSVIASQAAKDLLDAGKVHVNWEQDLGLPGLRKSKMAYQPTRFLKKYTVSKA